MKSFFKNIQLKPKKNKDISYDDELVNNLTIKTKPKLKVKNPNNCVVFCRACAKTCGPDAITFPDKTETTKMIKAIRKAEKAAEKAAEKEAEANE